MSNWNRPEEIARVEQVHADLAIVAAELEGVTPDELRVARVGVPGRVGTERRRDRAEAAVAGDRAVRELGPTGLVDLAEKRLREAEIGRIEVDRHRVVVDESGPAVAEREHRVVAQHPGVVEGEDLRPALQQVVVRIGKPRRPVEADLEVVRIRLVGAVVEVEAGERHTVVELVLGLEGVLLLEAVVDLGRARVVVRAVVDVDVGERQVAGDRRGHGIDAVRRDDVAGKRLPGQGIVNRHGLARRVGQPREVARRSAAVGNAVDTLRDWMSW